MPENLALTDVLICDPELRFVPVEDGEVLAGSSAGVHRFSAAEAEQISQVLARVDGTKTVGALCRELEGVSPAERTFGLLRSLSGRLVHMRAGLGASRSEWLGLGQCGGDLRDVAVSVLVLASGEVGSLVQNRLAASFATGSRIELRPFGPPDGLTLETLDRALPGFQMVVSALEDHSYRDLYETSLCCLRRAVPCLAVTVNSNHVLVGPTALPGVTPCVACAHLASSQASALSMDKLFAAAQPFRSHRLSAAQGCSHALELVGRAVSREVEALLGRRSRPELLSRILTYTAHGDIKRRSVARLVDCPLCGSLERAVAVDEDEIFAQARIELATAHDSLATAAVPAPETLCRTVGIIGGGTAGFLTALALRKQRPELSVTLIESSSVPIIGVGEATTPAMPFFLHQSLGLDIHEFFELVEPTFKLGIRFNWGAAGDSWFNYPFGPAHTLESLVYDGHIRNYSLYSMLMSADSFPLIAAGENGYLPLLTRASAYHLDNKRFVAYLHAKARDAGVHLVDALISDVEVTPDGSEVASLTTSDGLRMRFDLYVDCTGFRSLLLEKTLGSKFISFDSTLFTDHAVVAECPHHGHLRPYTLAETLPCGWCWNIPQMESDHKGYVFSSAFCTVDEAAREMRSRYPDMSEPWTVRFRSGRHEQFWKGNVVAIGNAYAFVEPLESTALHMVIQEIGNLVNSFPLRLKEAGLQRILSRKMNAHWDYLRWFLGLHYKFNRKLDTSFWRACREDTDISHFEELVAYFKERGPLSYSDAGNIFQYPDPLWGASGVDVILMGQGVEAKLPRPAVSAARWGQGREYRQFLVDRALSQARALEVWKERPELRTRYVEELKV